MRGGKEDLGGGTRMDERGMTVYMRVIGDQAEEAIG
jgi:hypothetical protein